MPSPSEPRLQASARCYACDRALEPVFDEHDADAVLQWDNALIVSMDGGYGMFVDPISPPAVDLSSGVLHQPGRLSVVICHDCAHDLCDRVPWMKELIEPGVSHTHRGEQRHPRQHPLTSVEAAGADERVGH